jgi:hypothetical protein
MHYQSLVNDLLASPEPSIRWKTRVNVLGENPAAPAIKKLRQEIKNSPHVQKLLSRQNADGQIIAGSNIYNKWHGAHWVMASLADIGYPEKDKLLIPVKDQLLNFWLSPYYYTEYKAEDKKKVYGGEGVPKMRGRYRRCASQQGNALYSITKLGLEDKRIEKLVERLLHWQWPDGGWNCDKNPGADTSSFMETILPLRGLSLYSKIYNDKKAAAAAKKAAEVFLRRKLFKSERTGNIIHSEFTKLHYPLYWHYDILHGLKVMAEAGFIKDKRCNDALDLLQSKMLKGGGWRAGARYYKVRDDVALGGEYVDWNGTALHKWNEWITADVLYVLKEAGRL